MEIIFSSNFNNTCFVDYSLEKRHSSFNQQIVGELGLLNILERELGLTGKYPSDLERVTHYAAALGKHLHNEPSTFYANAFQVDDMGVAKHLLHERDVLTMIGWQDATVAEPRLNTFRAIETLFVNKHFHAGVADRWQTISNAINHDVEHLKLDIVVCDNPELMHPFFRKLFLKLKHCVRYQDLTESIKIEENNLGKIKKLLLDENAESISLAPLAEDNSFSVLHLSNNYQAAEVLCNQIKQGFQPVIINAENALLDHYLVANDIPSTGSTFTNSNPSILQLFKLVSVCLISPLNVYNLLSFLQAPYSPLPLALRSQLARLLIASPGVKGEEWNMTIATFIENSKENSDKKKIKTLEELVSLFLDFEDKDHVSVIKAKSIYSQLQSWANLQKINLCDRWSDGETMQFDVLSKLSAALLEKLMTVELSEVEGSALLKWIENIYEPASFNNRLAQKEAVSVVSTPGQLLDNASFIWWNDAYNTSIKATQHNFLLGTEIEALQKAGIELYNPEKEITTQMNNAKRAILAADNQCVLVVVEKHNGENVSPHPILSEIEARTKEFKHIHATLENIELLTSHGLNLATTSQTVLPRIKSRWSIENPSIIQPRVKESPSSIDLLIHYPFDWVWQYQAKLRRGGSFTLPEVQQLSGNIAHATTQTILELSKSDGFSLTDELIKSAYDKVILEQGLVFLLPEMRFENEQFFFKLKDAIYQLFDLIRTNQLEYEDSEMVFEKEIDKIGKVEGRVDIVLKDLSGEKVIFDLKWSRSKSKYPNLIKDGKAIQLSMYATMEASNPRTAYYVFNNQKLYSRHNFEGSNVNKIDGISEHETLEKIQNSLKFRWEELNKGELEISENEPLETIPYHIASIEQNLIPLDQYQEHKSSNGYSGLELFKGLIS